MRARAGWSKLLPRLNANAIIVVGRTTTRDLFVLRAGDDLPPHY
jgi:hypothetical protein